MITTLLIMVSSGKLSVKTVVDFRKMGWSDGQSSGTQHFTLINVRGFMQQDKGVFNEWQDIRKLRETVVQSIG